MRHACSNRLKKASAILGVAFTLFLGSFLNATRQADLNEEYAGITRVLADQFRLGDCWVEVDVRRDWIASWTPVGFDVSLSGGSDTLRTTTSRWFKPTRIVDGLSRDYHFTWAAGGGEASLVASTLYIRVRVPGVQVDSRATLRHIRIETCSNHPAETQIRPGLEGCMEPVRAIDCE
jgi:hypothetical protein